MWGYTAGKTRQAKPHIFSALTVTSDVILDLEAGCDETEPGIQIAAMHDRETERGTKKKDEGATDRLREQWSDFFFIYVCVCVHVFLWLLSHFPLCYYGH